jgi:hypothetical protein
MNGEFVKQPLKLVKEGKELAYFMVLTAIIAETVSYPADMIVRNCEIIASSSKDTGEDSTLLTGICQDGRNDLK